MTAPLMDPRRVLTGGDIVAVSLRMVRANVGALMVLPAAGLVAMVLIFNSSTWWFALTYLPVHLTVMYLNERHRRGWVIRTCRGWRRPVPCSPTRHP